MKDTAKKVGIVVAMQDSTFSLYLLRALLFNPNYCVAQVCISSSPVKNKSTIIAIFALLKKLAFGYFVAKVIESIINSILVIFSRIRKKYDLESLSRKHNFKIIRSKNNECLKSVANKDLGLLSIHYLYLIEDEILNDFAFALNFHPALLPFGKGLSPQFHLLLSANQISTNGLPAYGGALHHITSEIDSGEIICRIAFYARDIKSSTDYMIKVHELFYEIFRKKDLLVYHRDNLSSELSEFLKKNSSRYFSYPSSSDFRIFKNEACATLTFASYFSFSIRTLFHKDFSRL